ncbi:hypothetical protein BpHYR1_021196 [Brachionus plicatilis]|uniref:Uncharacterized protein n=1 Tax=Brachionus plicatilis TaxID=10195 RepID=A0A3M7TAI4_BRAPC|nr:hypothetical protein BpHYR1_021196 [Brachionus plicatilis]
MQIPLTFCTQNFHFRIKTLQTTPWGFGWTLLERLIILDWDLSIYTDIIVETISHELGSSVLCLKLNVIYTPEPRGNTMGRGGQNIERRNIERTLSGMLRYD